MPVPVIESTSPTTSVQFVGAGLGIGIVPDVALLHHSALRAGTVKQIRVTPEPPASVVALIVRKGPGNSRVALLKKALEL